MQSFTQFVQQLKIELDKPLPGFNAQLEMAPKARFDKRFPQEPQYDTRTGGVLQLFYPKDNDIYMVFMKRVEDGSPHSGQISFPGGTAEKSDPSIEYTALREAKEEVGVSPEQVVVLGQLSTLFIPVSNFLVFTVVGYTLERPDFVGDPTEVDKIIEIPVRKLFAPENKKTGAITMRNFRIDAPFYQAYEYQIWGATAMMLGETEQVVRQAGLLERK